MAKQTFTTGQVLTAAQVNSLQTNDFNQTVSAKTASYVLVAADKGTRIEFSTSGSVTCTVNTGLFDAGDTVYIQNTGAGVVTITAGTATVNTSASLTVNQYEGGVLYFVSASSAIWFEYASTATGDITGITTGATSGLTGGVTSGTADLKLNTAAKGDLLVGTGAAAVTALTVGANNTVLTADSSTATGLKWAAAAGGGSGLTLISATTFTASSSHSVNNCFSSTYKYYLVLTDLTASTTNTSLNFRLRASSTDTTTNYDAVVAVFYAATAAAETNANGTDEVKFSSNKTSADVISARIEFYNPNAASQTSFTTHSAGGYGTDRFTWVGGGLQNSTTQFDGFSIYPAAGTITGSVKVYGYAN